MTAEPLTAIVTLTHTHTKTCERPPASPCKPAPAVSVSAGRVRLQKDLMTFLNSCFKRPVCVCSPGPDLLCYITVTQIRSSCTFLTWQLSDWWRIICCCCHVGQTGRGLLQKYREQESVDLHLDKFYRLQGGGAVWSLRKEETSDICCMCACTFHHALYYDFL